MSRKIKVLLGVGVAVVGTAVAAGFSSVKRDQKLRIPGLRRRWLRSMLPWSKTYSTEEVLNVLAMGDVSDKAWRRHVASLPENERVDYIARHNAEREEAGQPPREF